ncbi:hypothetical protein [Enterobacter cloacae]|uniref:hypothetical protein n=1 Tax=Enterobacter cloacae TaxID=550 RepID=UPI0039C5E805
MTKKVKEKTLNNVVKSSAVKQVEFAYTAIGLTCNYIYYEQDEIYKDDFYNDNRKYVITGRAVYIFTYDFFGEEKELTIIRNGGNTKPLILNVKAGLEQQYKEFLNNMIESYYQIKVKADLYIKLDEKLDEGKNEKVSKI